MKNVMHAYKMGDLVGPRSSTEAWSGSNAALVVGVEIRASFPLYTILLGDGSMMMRYGFDLVPVGPALGQP